MSVNKNLETIKKSQFKAKNYKNSPIVREFYRFVAKNGLRAEAFKLIQEAINGSEKNNNYLSNFKL